LQSKIDAVAEEMSYVEEIPDPQADTLVISWGVSSRAARQACLDWKRSRGRVAFLELKTLFPIPTRLVRDRASGRRRVIVVEENLRGLYASALSPFLKDTSLVVVGDVGKMIPPSRVREALESA